MLNVKTRDRRLRVHALVIRLLFSIANAKLLGVLWAATSLAGRSA